MVPARNGHAQPLELSLCMIVRDEEPRLRECLESIRPWVDEMVVVDTGSQDRSREIAAECGARVYEMPWPESFAAARNESLTQARGRWLFWMDADDVISPECGRSLRELVRRREAADAAFMVGVEIPPGPGEFSPSVVDHVKLFPNRPDLRFEHRIHEQILPAIRAAGLEVVATPLRVTHRNYDRSDTGQARKRSRDFRLLQLDLQDRPDHPFVLFNLGMTYLYAAKEYEVAAHYLRRSLDHSHPSDSIVRKAYAMLATARICQGEWEAAIQVNEEGRGHYPDDAELLFQAGQVYQQLGCFAEGRLALERLINGGDGEHYRSVDVGLRSYRGQHELALLYRRMGDPAHCMRALRDIAETWPGYLPAQLDLVETLHGLGRLREAWRVLDRLPHEAAIQEERNRLLALPWGELDSLAATTDETGESEPYLDFHGQDDPPADARLRAFFPDFCYRGVMVDVGAGLPTEQSASYHFERNGWRVICAEPNPHLAAGLRQRRAEVVECAVGDHCADAEPFTIVHSNFGQLSVSGLEVFPRIAGDPGVQVYRQETVEVPVRTLDWLLEHSVPEVREIDILTIDTEGYELPVLLGLTRCRPAVIMLENNRGQSDACRPLLEERGYELVLTEGLNEFYRRKEDGHEGR